MIYLDYIEIARTKIKRVALKFPYGRRLKLGSSVSFRRSVIFNIHSSREPAVVGDGVFFNNYCTINCNEYIQIGNNCLFGESVKLYDHNYVFDDPSRPIKTQGLSTGAIHVGDDCWIGANIVIPEGVSIGRGCIVGSGAVVSKDLPEDSVVIARQNTVIKKRPNIRLSS